MDSASVCSYEGFSACVCVRAHQRAIVCMDTVTCVLPFNGVSLCVFEGRPYRHIPAQMSSKLEDPALLSVMEAIRTSAPNSVFGEKPLAGNDGATTE